MKCPHCKNDDDTGKMIEPVCFQNKKPVSWICNFCGKLILQEKKTA